jgi:MFS family permease
MYGGEKNIRRNLLLYFIDGITFMPSMTLISITTVIPFFLEQLDATTFQIAIAASMAMVCTFLTQPLFGSLASRAKKLHMAFAKILFAQRGIFLAFVLCIPLFASNSGRMVWLFLAFWGLFNLFVGSYGVFFIPLLLKLLPPDRRGTVRGFGLAAGSVLGVGMAALIPVVLVRVAFPYNFVVIFSLGSAFLLINALVFLLMREHEDTEPRIPMGVVEYLKGIPSSVRSDAPFRALVYVCIFIVIANALLVFYTLYAIRVFDATEYHIATLAATAVIANAIGFVAFGFVVDRYGPVVNSIVAACLIAAAGAVALFSNTLGLLFVAWALANLGNTAYLSVTSLLIGEVAPPGKLPLYAGAFNIITLAVSSVVLLALAPALENVGFGLLFIIILSCGVASLLMNFLVLKKYMNKKSA